MIYPQSNSGHILCTYCGVNLDSEQIQNPRTDKDGDIMCDECYQEHYEFSCCWCQDSDHIDHQHKMLIVDDEKSAKLPRGVYEITTIPYYCDEIITSRLYKWALNRIADVPEDLEIESYPCGHLCIECQKKIADKIKKLEKHDTKTT